MNTVCLLLCAQSSEGDETQRLQKALLDYMDENAETDPALAVSVVIKHT